MSNVVDQAQEERDIKFIRNTSILSIAIIAIASFLNFTLGRLWRITQHQCSQILGDHT
ncbi:hypothetical protein RintRC_1294 [Richelia intracellularis]|nr:hypothetical protein RintRC_1294 [Richelia intracellularis]